MDPSAALFVEPRSSLTVAGRSMTSLECGSEMSNEFENFFRWRIVDGVGVFEIVVKELIHPQLAQQFGGKLRSLVRIRFARRMLLIFRHTKFMSSSAFGALLEFSKEASEAGVRIALCELTPEVKVGAEILQLSMFIPIFEDEASGLAYLQENSTA